MAIEMVDLSINSMVIFHSYVNVYQRLILIFPSYSNDIPIPLLTINNH